MKWIYFFLLAVPVSCTNSDVDNKRQSTSDSNSVKSIDSSAIINENSKLPSDSNTTTVTH